MTTLKPFNPKDKERTAIAAQVEQFLAKGGQIKKVQQHEGQGYKPYSCTRWAHQHKQ